MSKSIIKFITGSTGENAYFRTFCKLWNLGKHEFPDEQEYDGEKEFLFHSLNYRGKYQNKNGSAKDLSATV
ncbi:hypothetical protein Musp01_18060 [Muricauda sp. NBRC 101325]|nr:hypothetical protein Musp01_18060 [Muricauda sp. NBRC 101325]